MLKPQPNHGRCLEVLRSMTPEQRMMKAFELTEMTRQLLRDGLRASFPQATDEEIHRRYMEQLRKCHNSNY